MARGIKTIMDNQIIKVSTSGHGLDTHIDGRKIGEQISKKTKENILSGRWEPVTNTEIQMLREYREQQKLKKC